MTAQSEKVVLPEQETANAIAFSLIGEPEYFHRHRLEVEGVPEHRQAIYQSNWTGELGVRVTGLNDEPYTVQLDYVDLDMNAPEMRYFDILINGEVVKTGINAFKEVGLRRVLTLEFSAEAQDGVIEYFQRKHVPEAILSVFTVIRLVDSSGRVVAEKSAWDMRPPDWDLHGYLDKIYFGPIKKSPQHPPWVSTYKIRAHETDKLTAADVIGPDGIAYPNWTRVGIPGGIPDLETTISLADFGAAPNDDEDDSAAIQDAIGRLEREGGGVLFIPDGLYYLDRPIVVSGDNIVLRGNGSEKTRLVLSFLDERSRTCD